MSTTANNASANRDPGFFRRTWAMIVKEFVQMRRDRMTFASMMLVPGFSSPCSAMPSTPILATCRRWCSTRDDGPLTRAVLAAHAQYRPLRFPLAGARSRGARPADPVRRPRNLASRSRRASSATCARGDRPAILVIADATDPVATGTAVASLHGVIDSALQARIARTATQLGHQDDGALRYAPCRIATIRRASPRSISFRACSAWCSP